MKKFIYLLLFLFLMSGNLFSQVITIQSLDEFYTNQTLEKSMNGHSVDYSVFKGSPFVNEQFVKGDILTTSNTKYVGIPLRYNIYSDAIEFEGKNKSAFEFEKSIIKSVTIDTTEYIYKPYGSNNNINRSFFEVLLRGKATLLKKYNVRFEKEQPAKPFSDPVPAQFITSKPDFYVAFGESEARKIFALKDFIKIFPDKQSELQQYIKTNRLKLGNQEDLIKIIQYYNQ